MGFVLDFLEESSDHRISTYDTLKRIVEESEQDSVADYEDHLSGETVGKDKMYAETSPNKDKKAPFHKIDEESSLKRKDKSPIKYFLDGSRHVYKVGDIIISGVVYPIVVGQIIVGCCHRENRMVSNYGPGCMRQFVMAVPDRFDLDNHKKNFFKKKKEEINQALQDKYTGQGFKLQFDEILPYNTAGTKELGRNKYLHRAITVVQNQMADCERQKVMELCQSHVLDDENWLIKDGSLEYKHDLTNREDSVLDEALFDANMSSVLGVSKLFDPELLFDVEPRIGKFIAELEPCSRTNAYRYRHENKDYCVWYLRLRDTPNRATRYSDVIKVEFLILNDEIPTTKKVNIISEHLLNEAYPVCFGKDARWPNHLYPVHATEVYAKSQYINDMIIINKI